jgi:hypothetical protein
MTKPIAIVNNQLELIFANENSLVAAVEDDGETVSISAIVNKVDYKWKCHAYTLGTLINIVRSLHRGEFVNTVLLPVYEEGNIEIEGENED